MHIRIMLAALLVPPGVALASGAPAIEPEASPATTSATWRLQLRTDRHSDPMSLADLADDRQERLVPRRGRNVAYLDDEARLSRTAGDWTVSVLARAFASLVASRDAVALLRHLADDSAPASDTEWRVDARLRGFAGAGIELERALRITPRWQASASMQLLSIARWRERSVDGFARRDAASGAYAFDLRSSETYDRLDFPFQRDFAGQGTGLLLGGSIAWQGERAGVSFEARDFGWLRWDDVPRQDMTLSTFTSARDADGFLVYKPLVQGQSRQQAGYTAWWAGRWALRGTWQAAPATLLSASARTLPGLDAPLPAVALRQRLAEGPALGLGWQFHERRATLSLQWGGLLVQAGADRLGADARSRTLALAYAVAF